MANHGKNTTGEGMIPPAMGLASRADVHLKPDYVGGYHWGYLTALMPIALIKDLISDFGSFTKNVDFNIIYLGFYKKIAIFKFKFNL